MLVLIKQTNTKGKDMKVVVYLSGRSSTVQFHSEQDSMAGWATIPKKMQAEFVALAIDVGALEESDTVAVQYSNKLPTICIHTMLDVLADEESDGAAIGQLYQSFEDLANNECGCGVFHFVK
jgi:hypothetical protein